MKLSEIGGEFEFIKRVTGPVRLPPGVFVGVGDDCAVLDAPAGERLLVTTDMMVENDHFNLKWQTPCQVGRKLMESNVSDVVAMGGTPLYAFISLSLKKETTVEFMDDFYKGLFASGARHGVTLLGGDTTHGTEYVFNLTLLGSAHPTQVRLRSMAVKGDLICVSGDLGGSTAGLKLLQQAKNGYLKDHLEPACRTAAEGQAIARYAHAMIDVSDGLGSEVTHICTESKTGARIDCAVIPLSRTTVEAGKTTGLDPYDFALYGGEDFELVFTVPEGNLEPLRREFTDFTVVGEILDREEGISLFKDGRRQPLKKGYDHFA